MDSDFTAFFQPKVAEGMKRAALKKLLSDPHFNLVDGLDVYMEDFAKFEPMPDGMLDRLAEIYESTRKVVEPVEAAAGTDPLPDAVDPQEATAVAEPAPEAESEEAQAAEEPQSAALPAPEPIDELNAAPDALDETAAAVQPASRSGKPA